MWGGIVLSRRAEIAERHVGLFASERIVTAGDVVQLRKRGGDDDHRITAHYRYVGARPGAHGSNNAAARRARTVCSRARRVAVWYLPTEPEASWLDGYAPRPEAELAGDGRAACMRRVPRWRSFFAVRRQSNLLANGRPAMATVTKVEKKNTDKGTVWMVHYEWTTMSGATRTGKYNHGKKQVPAVGTTMPIVYDRDDTFRHGRYPMSFVRINGRRDEEL